MTYLLYPLPHKVISIIPGGEQAGGDAPLFIVEEKPLNIKNGDFWTKLFLNRKFVQNHKT